MQQGFEDEGGRSSCEHAQEEDDTARTSTGALAEASGSGTDSKSHKRNWRPYNDFDRTYYEQHKRRPNFHEARLWYEQNKEDFLNCNSSVPTWEELKIHRTR